MVGLEVSSIRAGKRLVGEVQLDALGFDATVLRIGDGGGVSGRLVELGAEGVETVMNGLFCGLVGALRSGGDEVERREGSLATR